MKLPKLVMRMKTTWYNKTKEKMNSEMGVIHIPGHFFGRVVTIHFSGDDTLPEETIERKVYRAGISGLIQMNKKFIGKIVEVEIEDSDVIGYFKKRFEDKQPQTDATTIVTNSV